MKKAVTRPFFPTLLLILVGCLWGNSARAEEETIILADGSYDEDSKTIVWGGDYCTITQAQAKGTVPNDKYISEPHWYKNNEVTFAAKDGYTLTGVTIEATSVSYADALSSSTYSSGTSASVAGTTVTITTSGDFTITMAEKSYISAITVSYISSSGLSSSGLAFEQDVYNMVIGGSTTVKATNESGADITYSVAENGHCSIDASSGVFTADAVGTYTVTATCEATDTYASGTATCQVVVTTPPTNLTPTILYKQITSTEEIVDGGVYLIVCKTKGDAMGAIDVSNKRVSASSAITIKDGKGFNYYDGKVNATGLPYEITITQADDGTYNLQHAEGMYINGTSDSNLNFNEISDAGWSISFVESTGNVEILHKDYNTAHLMRNSSATATYYKNYASGTVVQLYQKVSEMNVYATVKGYTTFVADFAYVMPIGLTGKTVSVADNGTMSINDAFQGGEEVPALTPLLVRTSEAYAAEETMKTYYPVITTKEVSVTDENISTLLDNNNLEYYRTIVDGKYMTSSKKLSDPCYYKLSIDNEGNNPGFYWGADNGAAFAMQNGSTAYLACAPLPTMISKFVIDDNGTTTAIEGVITNDGTSAESVVYNLQGIRVNPKNLQKGIYIINGHKTVVK